MLFKVAGESYGFSGGPVKGPDVIWEVRFVVREPESSILRVWRPQSHRFSLLVRDHRYLCIAKETVQEVSHQQQLFRYGLPVPPECASEPQ